MSRVYNFFTIFAIISMLAAVGMFSCVNSESIEEPKPRVVYSTRYSNDSTSAEEIRLITKMAAHLHHTWKLSAIAHYAVFEYDGTYYFVSQFWKTKDPSRFTLKEIKKGIAVPKAQLHSIVAENANEIKSGQCPDDRQHKP